MAKNKYTRLPVSSKAFSTSSYKYMPEPMLATAVASTAAPVNPFFVIAGLVVSAITLVTTIFFSLDEMQMLIEERTPEFLPLILEYYISSLHGLDNTLHSYLTGPVWLNISPEDQISILQAFANLETGHLTFMSDILEGMNPDDLEEAMRRVSHINRSFNTSDDPRQILESFFMSLRQQMDYFRSLSNFNE